MVTGNYILYGDRPTSESEIVDDHVQTRTAERKTKRKANRTANELQHTLNLAQLNNDTDSVKYEKKIKEPRLLRYVPTTDVEQHFVTEKFETYDLKPTIERPKRYAYVKKPKNPSDGPVNHAYSRSCSSSPNGNLPTISEHCEQYGTYRTNHDPLPNYQSNLEKYFMKPRDITNFSPKVDYNGSHPDSLYRVPPEALEHAGRGARVLRVLRWPVALLLVCIALAGFVYFLMPESMGSELDRVNSTLWDNTILSAGVGAQSGRLNDTPAHTTQEPTRLPASTKPNEKTPEIDFYDPDLGKDINLITLIDKTEEKDSQSNLPAPPVFPDHIVPEVQYGNEKADTRAPKILETTPADSTVKPQITVKPEKPLAVYFKDAATESITRAETINDLSNTKQTTKSDDSKSYPSRYKQPTYLVAKTRQRYNGQELPPEFQEFYGRPNGDVPLTSGHSKFFGIGIEDLDKMTSSTTQSSLYNIRVSPTLPTWRDRDDSTTKYYPVNDAPQCQSPRLPLCRGALPYDLAGQPPTIDGQELSALMPQIEQLISTNCSERIRHYLCAILEPECSPAPHPPKLPCHNFCQAMVDSCEQYVPPELSTAFKCKQYSSTNCATVRAPCTERELPCGDATCVPRDWVCDGKNDCPAGEDEAQCVVCNEFTERKCVSGTCILNQWVCDGYRDCPDGDDEEEEACEIFNPKTNPTKTTTTPRPWADLGEEPAESAPKPSVSKPSKDKGRSGSRKSAQAQADASQELLITSDSSNALKRNYTRRPSPSRLTPYVPRVRTHPTERQSQDVETEKSFKSMKTNRRRTPKPPITTPKPESVEDGIIGDLGLFELEKEFEEKKKSKIAPSQKQNANYQTQPDRPAETEKPAMRFDKAAKNYERLIDGRALMKQAAIEAAETVKAEPENTTYAQYDDENNPPKKGSEKSSRNEDTGKNMRIGISQTGACSGSELRCVDGRCISLSQLCDGTIDCSDHADEDNCYT